MVLRAVRMVAEHLNDPAVGDGSLRTLGDHPVQLRFQRRQTRDARLHCGKLVLRDDVGGCAGLVGPVGEAEQVADRLERKSEIARVANES